MKYTFQTLKGPRTIGREKILFYLTFNELTTYPLFHLTVDFIPHEANLPCHTFSKACSRSFLRSSTFSKPTLKGRKQKNDYCGFQAVS